MPSLTLSARILGTRQDYTAAPINNTTLPPNRPTDPAKDWIEHGQRLGCRV